MGKGLVGFRHAVRIIFTLHGGALPVIAVQQFGGHSLFHSLFTALARKLYNPTERESGPRGGRDFDRHLVSGAADAPRLYLQQRFGVVKGGLKHGQRILIGHFRFQNIKGAVNNTFCDAFLTVLHNGIDKFRHSGAAVYRVGQQCPLYYFTPSRHNAL